MKFVINFEFDIEKKNSLKSVVIPPVITYIGSGKE